MCAKKASMKKPAKAKAKKPTRIETLEEKAKLFDRIRARVRERRKLLVEKAIKESLGYCEREICGLGHALDEKHPMFDQTQKTPDEKTPEAAKPSDATDTPASQNAVAKPTDELWRQNSIAAAGLAEKQIDALEAAGLHTVGELQDAMKRHGEWWAKNTGVSGRLRQKIEDVFNEYITEVTQQAEAAKAA